MEQQNTSFPRSIKVSLALALLVTIGISVYFFFIRVQDGDYDAASKNIDTMVTKVNEIEQMAGNDSLSPATTDEVNLANAKKIADDYNSALTALDKSPAVNRDGEVKKTYSEVQKVISEYGKSTKDMVTTIEAVAYVKQMCNLLLNDVKSISSLKTLKSAETSCKDSLNKYTSVPLRTFNERYFTPYHKSLSNIVNSLELYYTAGEKGSATEMQKANKSVNTELGVILLLNSDDENYIHNSAGPLDQLRDLQAKIKQRHDVVLR